MSRVSLEGDVLASLPAWGVRVEICFKPERFLMLLSLPAWGVRVEMSGCPRGTRSPSVTPRMGSAG